jgi:hypothetical protein
MANIYLTHNDEGRHSGVHLWKISNLASIREQTVPVSLATVPPNPGRNYIDGKFTPQPNPYRWY